MMMVPYMFNEGLLDDLFDDRWERDFERALRHAEPKSMFGKHAANIMKTDVRETKDGYDVFVDLPGFKKEDVKLDLENGYLTITANRSEDLNEKDKEGHYIRQERCTGSCARSFYVGEEIKPEDVTAKFENGILSLKLPKAEPAKLPENKPTMIEIEG